MTNENKNLIYIPKDANYIEILGYKIDGFDSFEVFCEHLKKYAELEETVNRLQAENERLKGISDNKTKELLRYNASIEELHKKLETAKAEAYKECIEKVGNLLWQMKTEWLQQGDTEYATALVIAHTKLAKLLQEMVGENNELDL